jgi:threonine/homoserine/homoserine lactone efflux protein
VPELETVLVFVAATGVLFLIPGPSVIYIVTRSVAQGRASGLVSVLGMHVGTLPYVAIATLGFSALLASSSLAFQVLKYLGVAYLVWLGVQKLRSWRRHDKDSLDDAVPVSKARVFGQAVVVSALNPKTLLFYTALLPQFVDPARGSVPLQVLFFCAGFLVLGIISDGSYALLSSALSSRLRRNTRGMRRLDRTSGIVYLLLAAFAVQS